MICHLKDAYDFEMLVRLILVLCVFAFTASSTIEAAEPVVVTFRVLVEHGDSIEDGSMLELSGPGGVVERVPLSAGAATVSLNPGPWNWKIDDPRIVSSPNPLLIDASDRVIELRVQRLAPVTLTLAENGAAESRVSLATADRTVIPCTGDANGFTCMAPIGEQTLELRVQGWKAVPLGTHAVPRSGYALGELHLPSRGSIAGVIESGEEVELRLLRDRDVRNDSERSIATTRADDQGRFAFDELPPGEYWIDGETASEASARWGPFEVGDDAVVLEEPFVLEPAGRIDLQIVPPLDPLGEAWRVSLVPMSDDVRLRAEEIELEAPDDLGRVESGPIAPGRYIVRIVFDDSGGTFGRRVVSVAPETIAIEQLLLEPVHVRARVMIDEEPAPAGMAEILPLEAEVNIEDDGTFETFLPQEGMYTFDLVTAGRNVIRRMRVDRGSGGDARIEIDATTVELSGQVFAADGEPADANVIARWSGYEEVARTLDEGRFRFDVPRNAGRVELRAFSVGARDGGPALASASPRLAFRIGDSPILGRTLEMVPLQRLEVTVPDEMQPVAIYFGSDDLWQHDYAGRYEAVLELPADIETLTLCALPFERGGLQCTSHRASARGVTLHPAHAFGELVLEAGGALVPSEIPPYTLYWNDTAIPSEVIASWASLSGIENPIAGRVILPRVATGDVRVCAMEITDDGEEEADCVSGVIRPGDQTTLAVPSD